MQPLTSMTTPVTHKLIGIDAEKYAAPPVKSKDFVETKKKNPMTAFFGSMIAHFILLFRAKVKKSTEAQTLLSIYDAEKKLEKEEARIKNQKDASPISDRTVKKNRQILIELGRVNATFKIYYNPVQVERFVEAVEWLPNSIEDISNINRVYSGNPNSPITEVEAKEFRAAYEKSFDELASLFKEYRRAIMMSKSDIRLAYKGISKESSLYQSYQKLNEKINNLISEKKTLIDSLNEKLVEKVY